MDWFLVDSDVMGDSTSGLRSYYQNPPVSNGKGNPVRCLISPTHEAIFQELPLDDRSYEDDGYRFSPLVPRVPKKVAKIALLETALLC